MGLLAMANADLTNCLAGKVADDPTKGSSENTAAEQNAGIAIDEGAGRHSWA